MAAPLIPLLRQQIVNGSGAPYAGAKLYVYAAGTTTAQNSYSDSALATPNANPVVADADGRFGSIYLDPALSYKFVLKTSADVEVFTQDNVTTTGAETLTVLTKTANYTLLVGDGEDVLLLCDATAGNMTIALYTAVGNSGRKVRAIKTDTSANTVTIDPNGSQTINGKSTVVLTNPYDALGISSNGTNWIEMYRGLFPQVLTKTANYTLTIADGEDVFLLVDASLGAVTISVYTAVGNAGRTLKVMKIDSSANAVTIDPSGSQTIDGQTTWELHDQYSAIDLVADGSNWLSTSEPDNDNESLILAMQVYG